MRARRLGAGVVGALIVAFYGLAFLGAVGNGSWALVGFLCLPVVYMAVSAARARSHRPATVPAEQERG